MTGSILQCQLMVTADDVISTHTKEHLDVCQKSVRNVICSGASPVGLIDHLQFGSPENPEVFWTFQQAVAAIKVYCDSFKLPVVGGKVSFYNEKNGSPINPSPVIGAIGIGDDLEKVGTRG